MSSEFLANSRAYPDGFRIDFYANLHSNYSNLGTGKNWIEIRGPFKNPNESGQSELVRTFNPNESGQSG